MTPSRTKKSLAVFACLVLLALLLWLGHGLIHGWAWRPAAYDRMFNHTTWFDVAGFGSFIALIVLTGAVAINGTRNYLCKGRFSIV